MPCQRCWHPGANRRSGPTSEKRFAQQLCTPRRTKYDGCQASKYNVQYFQLVIHDTWVYGFPGVKLKPQGTMFIDLLIF